MRIAMVTGASAGLGRDFALQLDHEPDVDEIWLIARRVEPMQQLAGQLKRARARVIGLDLTDRTAVDAFVRETLASAVEIVWLVNNAGFGKIGDFDQIEVNAHLQMIDLNVRVLTELTQRLLPLCRRGSKIVQVASSAGFAPMAGFSVYAATKAYVVNFSQALAFELAPRGITVTAVCPGPVATEFFEVATGSAGAQPAGVPPARSEDVVRLAIRDARRGRSTSVYGWPIRLYVAASGWIPRKLVIWGAARAKTAQLRGLPRSSD